MSSKIAFSLEEDIVLAECESKHLCWYDLKHVDFKNQKIRENIFNEV